MINDILKEATEGTGRKINDWKKRFCCKDRTSMKQKVLGLRDSMAVLTTVWFGYDNPLA